jgi:hypothetical protein
MCKLFTPNMERMLFQSRSNASHCSVGAMKPATTTACVSAFVPLSSKYALKLLPAITTVLAVGPCLCRMVTERCEVCESWNNGRHASRVFETWASSLPWHRVYELASIPSEKTVAHVVPESSQPRLDGRDARRSTVKRMVNVKEILWAAANGQRDVPTNFVRRMRRARNERIRRGRRPSPTAGRRARPWEARPPSCQSLPLPSFRSVG